MLILVTTLLIIVLVFIGFDIASYFYQWQARIHIGRWDDRLVWQEALRKKALKWLRRSPTVKISDNDRWILMDMLRGKYRSRTIQSWQDAGLLFGLDAEHSAKYAAGKFDQAGNWLQKPGHIDAALLAYVLKKNGAMPAGADAAVSDLLSSLRSGRKTLPYRRTIPEIRFVDTIGMVVPYLTLCGQHESALAQIEEYDKALLPDSCIPPHAYDLARNVPMGIFDWGRGTGWYILGLIESNNGGQHNDRIVALAEELLRYRKKDGGYGTMFFNETSPFESSGSALIGLLMVRAYGIVQNPRFMETAFGIEKRLMTSTRRSGAIDNCQGDTKGIGYYSLTYSIMPFAQGVALRLSRELNQYADR